MCWGCYFLFRESIGFGLFCALCDVFSLLLSCVTLCSSRACFFFPPPLNTRTRTHAHHTYTHARAHP